MSKMFSVPRIGLCGAGYVREKCIRPYFEWRNDLSPNNTNDLKFQNEPMPKCQCKLKTFFSPQNETKLQLKCPPHHLSKSDYFEHLFRTSMVQKAVAFDKTATKISSYVSSSVL